MKKFLLIIFAILLIVFGIRGFYYFSRLSHAKTELGQAMLLINGQRYNNAVDALKDVIATYPYPIVKAPALYLLADIYEKQGRYQAAFEAHRMLITHEHIPATNDWLILSIIALSKLYRNDLLSASTAFDDGVQRYIDTIQATMALKEDQITMSPLFKWDTRPFISLQDNLVSLKMDKNEVLKYLKTELAFLYIKAKRYEDAAAIFEGLDTNAARFGMAQIYFEMGNYGRGIDTLKELKVHDTTGKISVIILDWMYSYAEILYANQCPGEAVELYKKIISLDPESRYAEFSGYKLANHFYASGETRNALLYIETTLSNNLTLKDEDTFLLKGYIYYDARDYYRALKVFDAFTKKYPQSNQVKTAEEWKAMAERSIKYLG
jgi:tetratricopeptide (TPR) repeat protein